MVQLINFMDGADVCVIERGSSFSLPLKAGQWLRVFGYIIRQEFERDKALEFNVVGLEDDTHAPAAKFLDNAIVGDGLVDHRAEGITEWQQCYGETLASQLGTIGYSQ
jgi:hypothetical protein